MVSRALTANDPLNDQRESETERPGVKKMVRKIFNNLYVNVFIWIVISSDHFFSKSVPPFLYVEWEQSACSRSF